MSRRCATRRAAISKVTFGVAVNRSWRNQQTQEWEEQTSFFNVVAWRQLAENVSASLTKGSRVVVSGRLEQRSWETESGEKRSIVEVVADDVAPSLRFATAEVHKVERSGPGGGGSGDGGGGGKRAPRPPRPAVARATTTSTAKSRSSETPFSRHDESEAKWHSAERRRARRQRPAPDQEEDVDPHDREHRLGRLQGREPAAAVHVGAGEDPGAACHRQQPAATGGGGARDPRRHARWRCCRTACGR